MVLRRSVLERETFDDELPGYCFGEDYDFWLRARRYGITGIYDRCIAVHLQAAGVGQALPKWRIRVSPTIGTFIKREFRIYRGPGASFGSGSSASNFR
jgi:hypothetical protein